MVELSTPDRAQKPLFDRLAELYAYDFSEITGLAMRADGSFPAHECFTKIWTDPDRHARLFWIGGEPAGFAIVHEFAENKFDMEQFFVLRKFRRSGVGQRAAHVLFDRFSGAWTVEQIAENTAAQLFWRKAISAYTKGNFEDTQGEDPVQSFLS